jgi:predicted SAM-dependent methyltransferase
LSAAEQPEKPILHVGCGDVRLDGFTNVDIRETPATDVTADLNEFAFGPESLEGVFSNAFFEHLYRLKREDHLRAVFRALDPTWGFACYIGVPYFKNVARLYLDKAPGVLGPTWDLYHVYRYTHGDPETQPDWWVEQLHKSLFDEDEVARMLDEAGFPSYTIFAYGFPDEDTVLPVTMGFYASKAPHEENFLRDAVTSFLQPFDGRFVDLARLEFLAGRG